MNMINVYLQKRPDESRYEIGLSPLHTWISSFEYFIHPVYRMNIKKWQVGSNYEKRLVADMKLHKHNEFGRHLDLIIDKPRSGGSGTSNHENIINNSVVSTNIADFNKDLIDRCSTIL